MLSSPDDEFTQGLEKELKTVMTALTDPNLTAAQQVLDGFTAKVKVKKNELSNLSGEELLY